MVVRIETVEVGRCDGADKEPLPEPVPTGVHKLGAIPIVVYCPLLDDNENCRAGTKTGYRNPCKLLNDTGSFLSRQGIIPFVSSENVAPLDERFASLQDDEIRALEILSSKETLVGRVPPLVASACRKLGVNNKAAVRNIFNLAESQGWISKRLRKDEESGTGEVQLINSKELNILELSAQGFDMSNISEVLTVPLPTVNNVLNSIRSKLESNSTTHAVLTAFSEDILDLEEIVVDFDEKRFLRLYQTGQRKGIRQRVGILEELIRDNGRNTRSKQIARALGASVSSVNGHLSDINDIFGTFNKTQAAVYYLYAKMHELAKPLEEI